MCGRVIIPDSAEINSVLGLKGEERLGKINVPPYGDQLPIFKGGDTFEYAYWPLIPGWSPEFKVKFSTLNAQHENLDQNNTWKKNLNRPCVVITKGFYEWKWEDPLAKKSVKFPHVIRAKDHELTLMAGLYEDWIDRSTGEIKRSCTIITNPANPFMAAIHNTKARMPAFLTPETYKLWVDTSISFSEREKCLEPVPDEFLYAKEIKDVQDVNEVMSALVC